MRIVLLAVGNRMPSWVNPAFEEYARRMPAHCTLELREVRALKRGKNADINRILEKEANALVRAIPGGALVIALERTGREISTSDFATHLQDWIDQNRDIALLVGGPEGLTEKVARQSNLVWSLSKLTYAHPLVRVIIAEQVYRAWSVCAGLPYHRGG
jgi:23S rRNA (pseudouridine1915-N3)-methyltransferase